MSTPTTSSAPAVTMQLLCRARDGFYRRFPKYGPNPSEQEVCSFLRELGADEDALAEARSCLRVILSDPDREVNVYDEAAVNAYVQDLDRSSGETLLCLASAVAALRGLLHVLPQRVPGEEGFTWEQVWALLLSECGADEETASCTRIILGSLPGEEPLFLLDDDAAAQWFREQSREGVLARLGRVTTPTPPAVLQ